MGSLLVNMQYLLIKVRKTKEVMKINKKAFSYVSKTLDLFLKTLVARLVNSLSERQDVQILFHTLVLFH